MLQMKTKQPYKQRKRTGSIAVGKLTGFNRSQLFNVSDRLIFVESVSKEEKAQTKPAMREIYPFKAV